MIVAFQHAQFFVPIPAEVYLTDDFGVLLTDDLGNLLVM